MTVKVSPTYPKGEILIDPTSLQRGDALKNGLNPDAGIAMLGLARKGKLHHKGSSDAEPLVRLAWDQLAAGTELSGVIDGTSIIGFDEKLVPSEVGIGDEITVRI
ncbi:MAG: hypothetical protein Q7T74_02760 [Candidatus Saccharibacteria bacterium]|nr:hypothetical protein [Candidatus Saccharibacteria bacterium]